MKAADEGRDRFIFVETDMLKEPPPRCNLWLPYESLKITRRRMVIARGKLRIATFTGND